MPYGIGNDIVRQRINRLPVNPLDKTTLVSVCPFTIHEVKPTIFPGSFTIEAAPDNDFTILIIGPSSWFKEMEEGQPFLEIQSSSIIMAQSLITDFCNGLIGCDMVDAMPGLFFIPGAYNKQSILKSEFFEEKLASARRKQKNWFFELVKIADMDWARTNGNPIAISDDARMAAQKLGLQKPWIKDFQTIELVPCKACGELINGLFPVCRHCHAVVDEAKAKELNIKFAV